MFSVLVQHNFSGASHQRNVLMKRAALELWWNGIFFMTVYCFKNYIHITYHIAVTVHNPVFYSLRLAIPKLLNL